jgi:hypothetical protein
MGGRKKTSGAQDNLEDHIEELCHGGQKEKEMGGDC